MTIGRALGAIIPLLIGAGFLAAGYFVDPAALTDDGYPLNYFFYFMGACFLLPALLTLLGLFAFGKRQQQKVEALLASGQRGTATILALEDTGVRINDNPRVKMMLEINIGGYSPYRVQKTTTIPMIYLAQVQPGGVVQIIADPHEPGNPDKVGLLLGGATASLT